MNPTVRTFSTAGRQFFYGLGASLGSVAFSDLLAKEPAAAGPLAPKKPMLPAQGEERHHALHGGRAGAHGHVRSEAETHASCTRPNRS